MPTGIVMNLPGIHITRTEKWRMRFWLAIGCGQWAQRIALDIVDRWESQWRNRS